MRHPEPKRRRSVASWVLTTAPGGRRTSSTTRVARTAVSGSSAPTSTKTTTSTATPGTNTTRTSTTRTSRRAESPVFPECVRAPRRARIAFGALHCGPPPFPCPRGSVPWLFAVARSWVIGWKLASGTGGRERSRPQDEDDRVVRAGHVRGGRAGRSRRPGGRAAAAAVRGGRGRARARHRHRRRRRPDQDRRQVRQAADRRRDQGRAVAERERPHLRPGAVAAARPGQGDRQWRRDTVPSGDEGRLQADVADGAGGAERDRGGHLVPEPLPGPWEGLRPAPGRKPGPSRARRARGW